MKRNAYNAPNASVVGPYSQAVGSGDTIYLSGQTPLDPGTGCLVEGGIEKQTEQCFKNIVSVLESAGMTLDNVEKVCVYLTDMNNFKTMNNIYSQQFTTPYPARTTIGVLSLPLDAEIEIEVIAKR